MLQVCDAFVCNTAPSFAAFELIFFNFLWYLGGPSGRSVRVRRFGVKFLCNSWSWDTNRVPTVTIRLWPASPALGKMWCQFCPEYCSIQYALFLFREYPVNKTKNKNKKQLRGLYELFVEWDGFKVIVRNVKERRLVLFNSLEIQAIGKL